MISHGFRIGRVLAGLVLVSTWSAAVRAEWVYVEEEGGWKDTETGLVWVDYSESIAGPGDDSTPTFPEAQTIAATLDYMGFTDWRTPTVGEMQMAVLNGIDDAVPLYGYPGPKFFWWSSEKRGKAYGYAVDLRTGEVLKTTQTSQHMVVCVRQGIPGP